MGKDPTGSGTVGDGTCIGKHACSQVAWRGLFEAANGSCLGQNACYAAAKETGGNVTVGVGSCISNKPFYEEDGTENGMESRACEHVGEQGDALIGEGSCVGRFACRQLARGGTATIGDDSCHGADACTQSANDGGELIVGNGSCKGKNACRAIGQREAVGVSDKVGNVQIGDGSCNCAGCCQCLKPYDRIPDGMCNELGLGETHCCLESGDRNPYGPLKNNNLCWEEVDKCYKASVTGDPHITTYSGLKFDCMAQGEFILSKSQSEEDPLEIRALFVDPEFVGQDDPWENKEDGAATTTRGVAFIVDDSIPMIRITTDHEKDSTCQLYYYVEGAGNVTGTDMLEDNELFDREKLTVSTWGATRELQQMKFNFGDYDAELSLTVRPSEKWGCIIGFHSCLKPSVHPDVIGLFGTNNIHANDDWMTPDGTTLLVPWNPKDGAGRGASSAYCREQWCNKVEGTSFFSDYDFDFFSRCDKTPYSNFDQTTFDEMLVNLQESCDEIGRYNIPSEVLYDAALEYHITDPNNITCPTHLLDEAEKQNKIDQVNCDVVPTPSPTNTPLSPTPNPTPSPTSRKESTVVKGDPHFTTWVGEHFEYHGQCDMVMLKDPSFANGLGIQIQIRTKLVRYWSYIRSVAILIGDDILEIEGSDEFVDNGELFYWHNLDYQAEFETLGGFPVSFHRVSKKTQSFVVDLSSKYPDQFIEVKSFKEFVKVAWNNGSEESVGNSVGMMGDFKTGKTLGRDGTVIDDFTELGAAWQARPDDGMLFHDTTQPQFPKSCVLPEDPRGQRRRRLDATSIKLEDAEKACESLKDPKDRKECVYDVLATQDLEMVGAF